MNLAFPQSEIIGYDYIRMIKKAQWLLKDKKKYSKDYKYILIIYPNICPNMQREVWQTWKLIKRGRWIVRNATFARSKEKRYLLTWPINYPIRADRFGSLPQTLSPCSTLSCNSYIPHAPYPSLSLTLSFFIWSSILHAPCAKSFV